MSDDAALHLIELTADIVSTFVANNQVSGSDLPRLVISVHAALSSLDRTMEADMQEPAHVAAVSARRSLASREHIVSMIDGRPYRSMKRHLARHGLSPDEYRARYNLPPTYPMVAPAYSEARRKLAIELGLGAKAAAGREGRRSRARKES